MHQIYFRSGAHDALPGPLVGWGRGGGGYALYISHPLNAYGVLFSAPSAPHL